MLNEDVNVLVEKVYYVLVNEAGDYIKLDKDNRLSIVKKTYQATKGTKEEMIRFYANLEKLIKNNPFEYPDIKFGGLLGIVERVENNTYIDLNEINNILNEFEPKDGLETSGQQVVQVGLNIVQSENQLWEDFQSILNKELGLEDSEDILVFNNQNVSDADEYDVYFDEDTPEIDIYDIEDVENVEDVEDNDFYKKFEIAVSSDNVDGKIQMDIYYDNSDDEFVFDIYSDDVDFSQDFDETTGTIEFDIYGNGTNDSIGIDIELYYDETEDEFVMEVYSDCEDVEIEISSDSDDVVIENFKTEDEELKLNIEDIEDIEDEIDVEVNKKSEEPIKKNTSIYFEIEED